ncbi:Hsp20 [Blastocystis sp. ATCC 50177/Nand II]|uniref:Hsp20 n=1 Tax=Blastocystis sp. subtype 1 (strain ATCC 50177 / NandII) TaxID=478820 RepID=A0A196S9Q7_BLAHN|nr:Hsp20 [Blastocystis sp. ATCC 50177/Nand II]
MSILNFASNKFFDDDDYALSAVAKARLAYDNVNPNLFPLNVDLIEAPTMYVVIADVPGVSKDRITVSVKDDKILIEGKRKKKVISNEDSYLIEERRNGPFKKMLQMPLDADTQKMTAKMEDGLLVLTVPRVSSIEGAKTINIA